MIVSDNVAVGRVHEAVVPDTRVYFKPIPNLYIYDHCPFCVKARMIFGIKNIKVNLIVFANDDFEGPISLIGKKAVPILEYSHAGSKVVMPESGDIVKHVDTHPHFKGREASVAPGKKVQEINNLWSSSACHDLVCITTPERQNLAEFQSVQSRQTFIVRHKLNSGLSKFNEAWKHYDEYVAETNKILVKCDELLDSENYVTGDSWSWDDIEVFAWARALTGVDGIKWPTKLKNYLISVSKRVDIPLYFNAVVGPTRRDPALFDY
eukprot:Gregarina_sp_Pseudo_9__2031@NODE_2408_length_1004_cov_3243_243523_g2215_i0_p1_GENE_NODE_2408_length_1004_cov_3243_243523_g2215_i0NODE_2408_length_1004_cov_3243_243523_g2215_i0_p1_ORF_typecomplete_len265_score37_49Glutaredoxin2_C/PF04399_13/1e26GST_N_3/PF13417_6/9_5e06GST_C/PF00043_25/0_0027GST_C_3/PF14497_6/0_024GST_N_2/PF13409_6/0_045Glutaredoxin/PF00462_24/0_16_NODE_2408_length_1004_cov_3243_243523_g2215_i0141935